MTTTERTYNLHTLAEDYAALAVAAATWEASQDDADPHAWDLGDIIDAANDNAWQTVDGCEDVIYHYHAARLVAENLSEAEDAAASMDMGDVTATTDLSSAMSLYAFALILNAAQALIPERAEEALENAQAVADAAGGADA